MFPFYRRGKLRPREVKFYAQGHIAEKGPS